MKQWEEYRIPAEEVRRISRIPITCLEDQTSVFSRMALEMAEKIEDNNRQGKRTVFIIPFGPTGQYPVFVDLVNTRRISLKKVWLITMDDWLDSDGGLVGLDNIHSLRRKMNQVLYSKIDKGLVMPEEQRIYPDPGWLERIPDLIEALGGVDICFAGFGINGHLGFNEPADVSPEEFAKLPTRVVRISETTRTIKASTGVNGAMEDIPFYGITVGMREMLCADKVSVYCFRDWHSGAIRRAGCGTVSSCFPASLLQNHPNAAIVCSPNAIAPCY